MSRAIQSCRPSHAAAKTHVCVSHPQRDVPSRNTLPFFQAPSDHESLLAKRWRSRSCQTESRKRYAHRKDFLPGLCPGARKGAALRVLGVPPSVSALLPPPKKRKRFRTPDACRPSLASDASEVLLTTPHSHFQNKGQITC